MATVLRAERLTAGYGEVPVIRDLDLHVDEGEMVALLGANGAGKTTTLLALAGDLPASGGVVTFRGAPTTASLSARARAGLGFITEERSVFMSLSALDNLRLGRGEVADAIALFPELEPLLGRRAGLLSGGEQQMLTLARALAGRPVLLLIDELSLGLAPLVVERLFGALRQACAEGVAVLVVEQHLEAALRAADRGYVLRRGEIVMHGDAGDLAGRIDEVEDAYLSRAESGAGRSEGAARRVHQ